MDPGHAPNQPQPRLQTHPNSAWPRPGQILFRPSSQPGILVLPWLRPEPGPAPKGSSVIATPIDLVLLKLHPFEGCGYNGRISLSWPRPQHGHAPIAVLFWL